MQHIISQTYSQTCFSFNSSVWEHSSQSTADRLDLLQLSPLSGEVATLRRVWDLFFAREIRDNSCISSQWASTMLNQKHADTCTNNLAILGMFPLLNHIPKWGPLRLLKLPKHNGCEYGFAWFAIILSWFIFDDIWDLGLNLHHNPGYSGDFQFKNQSICKISKRWESPSEHFIDTILDTSWKFLKDNLTMSLRINFGFHLSFTNSKRHWTQFSAQALDRSPCTDFLLHHALGKNGSEVVIRLLCWSFVCTMSVST